MELTQELLKELLHYDPDSGVFNRNSYLDKQGRKRGRKLCGTTGKTGYIRICINNKKYLSHRLAWLYVFGSFPVCDIDHINGIHNDNRIVNLREATVSQNQQNMKKAQKNNKSTGLIGASFFKRDGNFKAQICLNGKNKHLGLFKTPEEAHERYLQEKRIINPFGEI